MLRSNSLNSYGVKSLITMIFLLCPIFAMGNSHAQRCQLRRFAMNAPSNSGSRFTFESQENGLTFYWNDSSPSLIAKVWERITGPNSKTYNLPALKYDDDSVEEAQKDIIESVYSYRVTSREECRTAALRMAGPPESLFSMVRRQADVTVMDADGNTKEILAKWVDQPVVVWVSWEVSHHMVGVFEMGGGLVNAMTQSHIDMNLQQAYEFQLRGLRDWDDLVDERYYSEVVQLAN